MGNNQIILHEHISLMVGLEKTVFSADRYFQEGYKYTSTYWQVDSSKSKEDYIKALRGFYYSLKMGAKIGAGFTDQQRVSENGVKLMWKGEDTNLALDDLMESESKILAHPHFNDFLFMRADTPYGAIAMEDRSGKPWNSETGKIGCISHLNISMPLAIFIQDTTKHKAPYTMDVEETLRHAYTFK